MTDLMQKRKGFVSYDYYEINVIPSKVSLYLDGYVNFGWQLDENIPPTSSITGTVTLRFKRDRRIINKTELTRLQRNFEACIREIDMLEESKTSMATAASIAVGIIGTAFMAGSVFAVTADKPMIVLCILLAIPGFIGWILPYLLFQKMTNSRTEKVAPLIEDKYDEMYAIVEKGNRLLSH
ncbi:MAG: DUF2207 domain-containing protein [Clostridiales bacterium]|nr:DUF2207 domain-containing protein [Clostridiales bacterium]